MKTLTDKPEQFIYSINYKVLYSDINGANHVGADRILPIALEAQLSLTKHLGYADAIVFEDLGLIMANSQIDYLSETHYGEELKVNVALDFVSEKAIDLIYCIWNCTKRVETARVKTRMLFFDYKHSKATAIPSAFKDKINALPKVSF
jgi:acyl-CoA thioesterase FadM